MKIMCIKSITDPHICFSKSETCLYDDYQVHYIHTLLKQKHSKIQEYKIKNIQNYICKTFF